MVKNIYQFRRKGANNNFFIKNTTLVCELHFKVEDIQFGRKTLKKGAFSSIFTFKKQLDAQKGSSPRKRKFLENLIIQRVILFLDY